MPFTIIITRDFDHMSEVAAGLVTRNIRETLAARNRYVLGLATGNTPTGLYKHLAKAANRGEFDSSRITSFNLDEYIGLPGENAQQRVLHPESYSFFMTQELFGLMQKKIKEVNVPWGTLIDQKKLEAELEAHPDDWEEQGTDKGKAIVIKPQTGSPYLRWIKEHILEAYAEKIISQGGIDLHIIGVGGKGHVAFHEAGIPFENNPMLLVRLDANTVENAVKDGHFVSKEESPLYAVSMGAELVYKAKTVVLLANGARKADPIAESVLDTPSAQIPISYGQIFARNGGNMFYILDRAAGRHILQNMDQLSAKGFSVRDISNQEAAIRVEELSFHRNPQTSLMG